MFPALSHERRTQDNGRPIVTCRSGSDAAIDSLVPAACHRRTTAIYEPLAGYAQPPLGKTPDPRDPFSFQLVQPGRCRRAVQRLFRLWSDFSGFARFVEVIEPFVEEVLRNDTTRLNLLAAHQYSGTLVLEDDPQTTCPFQRAASLIIAAYQLREDLLAGRLEPDRLGNQALEMGQYPNLFGTQIVVDDSGIELFKTSNTSHILVLVRGQFFIVNFGATAGELDLHALAVTLQQIASLAQNNKAEPSPAVLTCGEPDRQMQAFARVRMDRENERNLEKMKHCLLAVCLDLDGSPATLERAAHAAHVENMDNRWWHASLQLVVFANGRACAIHSFAANLDGNVMMRSTQELAERSAVILQQRTPQCEPSPYLFEKLTWHVQESTVARIRQEVDSTVDAQEATFHLDGLGSDCFHSRGLAPVQTLIAALQLSVQQLIGRTPSVYQLVSQSSYRCLGLRIVNVATKEVEQLGPLVRSDRPNSQLMRQLLSSAIEAQRQACRAVRAVIPIEPLLHSWITSQPGAAWFAALMFLLLRPSKPDIMVSHPAIASKIPVVGRPGAKLAYVKQFGLHYQIHADRTTVTVMPGVKWKTANRDLIKRLEHNLKVLICTSTEKLAS